MYYLYRHIRLDKNEPFYIGIAKRNKVGLYDYIFKRAFSEKSRNKYWQSITAKTDYEVEILFESDSRDSIEEKEKEFIQLYGRKDLGKGTLCNMTDGGDGHLNPSKEIWVGRKNTLIKSGVYDKMVDRMMSYKFNAENNSGIKSRVRKDVYAYNLDGSFFKHFISVKQCLDELGICSRGYWLYRDTNTNFKNHLYFTSYRGDKLNPDSFRVNTNRKLGNKSMGAASATSVTVHDHESNLDINFPSIRMACEYIGIAPENISKYISKHKRYKNFTITKNAVN